jgi:hypothetical protein
MDRLISAAEGACKDCRSVADSRCCWCDQWVCGQCSKDDCGSPCCAACLPVAAQTRHIARNVQLHRELSEFRIQHRQLEWLVLALLIALTVETIALLIP